MPTLPLYLPCDPNTQTDSWRRVRIPSGFECWRFKTYEKDGMSVELDFSLGSNPQTWYWSRYRHWTRRPTRHRPPVSMDEPSVGLVIWPKYGRPMQVRQRAGTKKFQVGVGGSELRIASSTLSFEKNNSVTLQIEHWRLSGMARFDAPMDLPLREPPLNHGGAGPFLIARRRYTAHLLLSSPNGAFDPIHLEGEAEYEHLFGGPEAHQFTVPGWTFRYEQYERATQKTLP